VIDRMSLPQPPPTLSRKRRVGGELERDPTLDETICPNFIELTVCFLTHLKPVPAKISGEAGG